MRRLVVLLVICMGMAKSASAQTCPCDSCAATLKSNCGEWSAIPTANWPIRPEPFAKRVVPVHMVLTKTGRVLMWKNPEASGAGAHYWDPDTYSNTVLPVTMPVDSSLFCAGHIVLSDGRVLTVGGQCSNQTNCSAESQAPFGIKRTMVFDPDVPSSGFIQRRDMAHPRW